MKIYDKVNNHKLILKAKNSIKFKDNTRDHIIIIKSKDILLLFFLTN